MLNMKGTKYPSYFTERLVKIMYKDFDSMSACAKNDGSLRCRRMEMNSGNDCSGSTNSTQKKTWGLENYPLASVYAPIQDFDNLYDKETALMKGTLFAELDLPFLGESVYKGGNCRG